MRVSLHFALPFTIACFDLFFGKVVSFGQSDLSNVESASTVSETRNGAELVFVPDSLPVGFRRVKFELWKPTSVGGNEPIRGILASSAYAAGARLHDDPQWRGLAQRLRFACLRYTIESRESWKPLGKDKASAELLRRGLAGLATIGRNAELEQVPLVLTGLSQAGWQAVALSSHLSDRVLAVVAFHEATPIWENELNHDSKAIAIPCLHVMGGRCWLTPYIQPWVEDACGRGALWTTLLQPEEEHARLGELTLVLPWIERIAAARIKSSDRRSVFDPTADFSDARYGRLELKVGGEFIPYSMLAPKIEEKDSLRERQVRSPKTTRVGSVSVSTVLPQSTKDVGYVWLPDDAFAQSWKEYHAVTK